ncbi:hypothetical protein ACN26Y_08805 [Micromonospora sp. WMMD558]|uniref:hypothetical protein n=1 Tax=Micromonospora sp. WMMD558 TaxID=3403462 RepID=UPI003BF52088
MNEVEQLRQAMRATERAPRGALDLGTIMREGRRIRRRRQLAGAGGAALSVAVVLGVAVGVLGDRPPQPEPQPAPVATAPAHPTAAPGPTEGTQEPRPVGDVVDSGIRYGGEERVFYFVRVDLPRQPRVTIGLVAGRRTADGTLTSDFLANDVEGSDRRPGFHAIGYDQAGPVPTKPQVPTFGYFVGPAQRIVGTVDGRQITARQARWSEDPQVVIFWFEPRKLAPGTPLDGIVARDVRGRKL